MYCTLCNMLMSLGLILLALLKQVRASLYFLRFNKAIPLFFHAIESFGFNFKIASEVLIISLCLFNLIKDIIKFCKKILSFGLILLANLRYFTDSFNLPSLPNVIPVLSNT